MSGPPGFDAKALEHALDVVSEAMPEEARFMLVAFYRHPDGRVDIKVSGNVPHDMMPTFLATASDAVRLPDNTTIRCMGSD